MNTIALGLIALVLGAASAGGPPAEPLVPSTPHRVLELPGQGESWYLIEADRPLEVELDGPGLVELELRRVLDPGEPAVQPSSVQVALDGAVQPPITFRRAREERLRFVDEPRLAPSAPREARIAIPLGGHRLRLESGADTTAVAVALRYRRASARAEVPIAGSDDELPPLEPIPTTAPVPPVEPAVPVEASVPVEPAVPVETTAPGRAEPPAQPVPAEPSTAVATTAVDPATARPGRAEASTSDGGGRRVASLDVGLGLSTTFVGLGGVAPTLRLGGRYVPPWLDGQLRLGADLSAARYTVRSAGDEPSTLEASNWVVPVLAVAALAPRLPWRWLALELGGGVGLAVSAASLRYQGLESGSVGVGGAAALYAEAGVPLGPVALCARVQLDAISASNDVFRRYNYFGAAALLGARWWF